MTDPFRTPGQPSENTAPTHQQPTEISQQYTPPPPQNSFPPQQTPPPQNNPWQPQTNPGQPQFAPNPGYATPPGTGNYQYYGGGQPPAQTEIPIGARVAAYIVSALKAIPLVIMLIGGVFLAGSSNEYGIFSDIAEGAAAVLVVLALLGFVLVIGQIVMAAKNSRTGLLVFASIMLAIDVLWLFIALISTFANDSNGYSTQDDTAGDVIGLFVVLATGAAQLFVVISTAKSQKSAAAPVIQQQF